MGRPRGRATKVRSYRNWSDEVWLCHHCEEEKSQEEFYGIEQTWCKSCNSENARKNNLRRYFGITVEQYNVMLEAQHGVCAICGVPPPDKKRLAVDHCHKTGVVRGLLCVSCNNGLGLFRDSPDNLLNAVRYLISDLQEKWELIEAIKDELVSPASGGVELPLDPPR